MSTIKEFISQAQAAVDELQDAERDYKLSLDLLDALEAGTVPSLQGVGLQLVFDGDTRLPIPIDAISLSPQVAASASNAAAMKIVSRWKDLKAIVEDAVTYCDDAVTRMQEQQGQASQPTLPQAGLQRAGLPRDMTNHGIPQQPSRQPRLNPLSTEAVK